MKIKKNHLRFSLVLVFLCGGLLPAAQWDGGGDGVYWNDPANWVGDVKPVNGDGLVFDGGAATTINDISGLTIVKLEFKKTGWMLNGNAVTLSGSGQLIAMPFGASGSCTVGLQINAAANGDIFTGHNGGAQLILSSGLSAPANTIKKDGGDNALVFSGGSGTIDKLEQRKGPMVFTNGADYTFSTYLYTGNDATFVYGGISYNPSVLIEGASTVVTGNDIQAGRNANVTTINQTGGLFQSGNRILLGQSATATVVYHLSGGEAIFRDISNANNGISTINVIGGTLTCTRNFRLTEKGTGTLTISDTGLAKAGTDGSGTLDLAFGTGSGTLNLDGGTLRIGGFTRTNTTGNVVINFNGGTLQAGKDSATFLNALAKTVVYVGAAGAVIDTDANDITIAAPLAHSPALGHIPDGGLLKKGAGTLTLASTSYTGATWVEEGTLSLLNPQGIWPASNIYLVAGTVLDLSVGGSARVNAFFIEGIRQASGVWGAVGSGAEHQTPLITGTGTVLVGIGAYDPLPGNGDKAALNLTQLAWTNPDPNLPGGTITCDLYFGTNEPNLSAPHFGLSPVAGSQGQAVSSYPMPVTPLSLNTTYFWAVECHDSSDGSLLPATLWSFDTTNEAPAADAGPDQYLWLNNAGDPAAAKVTLSGSAVDDGVAGPLSYSWAQASGPAVAGLPSGGQSIILDLPAVGAYVFELTANDTDKAETDSVTVTVSANACDAAKAKGVFVPMAGDLNTDCVVNMADFALLAAAWLECNSLDTAACP